MTVSVLVEALVVGLLASLVGFALGVGVTVTCASTGERTETLEAVLVPNEIVNDYVVSEQTVVENSTGSLLGGSASPSRTASRPPMRAARSTSPSPTCGLLRAVGLQRRQLRRMMRVESVVIALYGALLGLLVGSAFGLALARAARAGRHGVRSARRPPGSRRRGRNSRGVLAALPARRAARLGVLAAAAPP